MTRILFLVGFSIVGISLFYFFNASKSKQKELPIYNPIDLEQDVVDPELLRIGRGHTIGAFSFLNQDGKKITQKDVQGKVFVAEYFFTTCGTICPMMNKQMQRIQQTFNANENVKLLSFTVDPEIDDVKQMHQYATSHKASSDQWWFLTGEKTELYALARKSFFLLKPAEAQNLGDAGSDFIHTNNFVLVDQQMRIRGYYDGTNAQEVDQLMQDMEKLLADK